MSPSTKRDLITVAALLVEAAAMLVVAHLVRRWLR